MKFAVIGSGSIGKRHIGNLIAKGIPASDIVAMDTRADRREEVTARFGVTDVVSSFEEVAKRDLTGALICSPTSMHIDQAIPLVAKGTHLLIEKPLDASLKRADELSKAVAAKGTQVLVAYCFRFSNHARKLKELVDAQVVGRPLYVRGEFSEYLPDWHPYEDYRSFYMAKTAEGGGSILDQSHILDIAHWLMGDVEKVFAFNGRISDLEVETDDVAEMQVRFKSGVIGTVHQDMFGRKHTKNLEVKCTRGNIYWDVYDLSVSVYDVDTKLTTTHHTAKDHQIMYLNETQHFLDLCTGKEKKSVCTLEEGIHGMKVLEAAIRSSKSDRLEAVE